MAMRLAFAYEHMGDYWQAEAVFRQAIKFLQTKDGQMEDLEIAPYTFRSPFFERANSSQQLQVSVSIGLGNTLICLQKFEDASCIFRDCLRLAKDLGLAHEECCCCFKLGETRAQLGEDGFELFRQSFKLARELERTEVLYQVMELNAAFLREHLHFSGAIRALELVQKTHARLSEHSLPAIAAEPELKACEIDLETAQSYFKWALHGTLTQPNVRLAQSPLDGAAFYAGRALKTLEMLAPIDAKAQLRQRDCQIKAHELLGRILFSSGENEKEEAVQHLKLAVKLITSFAKGNCAACGQICSSHTSFMTCSGCQVSRFCNKQHQRYSWGRGGHKEFCQILKTGRQAAKDEKTHLLEYLNKTHAQSKKEMQKSIDSMGPAKIEEFRLKCTCIGKEMKVMHKLLAKQEAMVDNLMDEFAAALWNDA